MRNLYFLGNVGSSGPERRGGTNDWSDVVEGLVHLGVGAEGGRIDEAAATRDGVPRVMLVLDTDAAYVRAFEPYRSIDVEAAMKAAERFGWIPIEDDEDPCELVGEDEVRFHLRPAVSGEFESLGDAA